MLHCDLRVRWKVASDLRFEAAISEPKNPFFCGIPGDLAPSTRKALAIAIVRFWCAKPVLGILCTMHNAASDAIFPRNFVHIVFRNAVIPRNFVHDAPRYAIIPRVLGQYALKNAVFPRNFVHNAANDAIFPSNFVHSALKNL